MKKRKLQILSLLLCFAMVSGIFADVPVTAFATGVPDTISNNSAEVILPDAISVNSVEVPLPDTSENSPVTITMSFYDTDGTTLLLSVPMQYDGTAQHLNDYLADIAAISMTRKGYSLDKWYCPANGKYYSSDGLYYRLNVVKDWTFHAVWEDTPYEYDILYETNGGSFSDELEELPESFNVTNKTIILPMPQRKGYVFDGWYSDSALTMPVASIPGGTYIDSDEKGTIAPYKVYAKWSSCKPQKVSKPTAKNSSKGKVTVSFKSVAVADGYEVTYATSKNFKKDKLTKDLGKKVKLTLTNLPSGKTYYFKVRAYRVDSTGEKCYGSYSSVRSCKVKKGVKEYTAKKNSGKLKKVVVKGKTDLYVTATVSKRLKSSDGFYYLVKVDPNSDKILKQISKTDKTTSVKFRLPLKDDKGNNHIQGKYGVAIKKGKKYMLITRTAFISNPEAAAAYNADFPKPASKKGRQGCYDSSLGDKNYFTNFTLNSILGTKSSYNVAYKYNGKTYYFYYPNFGPVSQINEDGGTVTIQIMLQYDKRCKDLILPSGRKPGAHYYAFNTDSKAAREKLEAAFHFITEYASKENYHVDNWILGNEVNTYANMNAKWYYAGNISREKFIKNYASTFRMLYYAVKSNNKNGRVYICCDHTWINRENDWGTRYFTEAFHNEIKKQNKKIQWNLAYHAYSAVLTNADFWNDGKLAPKNLNADFVSPNNLEIMTEYIKDTFGENVRIILSEQGFSCSGGVGSPYNNGRQAGQDVQAAATAYLYYKAQFNDMIDAVIYSSGDHGGAGYQFDFIGREAENVYKYMDTPKYGTYVNQYLKTIGASSWKKIVPGFNARTLKKMPTR